MRQAPEDFAALGLSPDTIAVSEDAMRSKHPVDRQGAWEWWYVDCELEDGNSIAMVYKNADNIYPIGLAPQVEISFAMKDGTSSFDYVPFRAGQLRQSREKCDLHIGKAYFTGDLETYRIHFEGRNDDDVLIVIDLEMESTCEPWRPATGQFVGDPSQSVDGDPPSFNWFCALPGARVKAKYRIGDQSYESEGTGYHDHNWGNVPMQAVVEQWYWGHGNVGPYTVVAYPIQQRRDLGGTWSNVFMLARDGKVIVDDISKVTFEMIGEQTVPDSDLKLPQTLKFTYEDGDTRYVSNWEAYQPTQLVSSDSHTPMGDLDKFGRYEMHYTRFVCRMSVEKFEKDVPVEKHEVESAIWEYMQFGNWTG
ncbi:hypothetical protein [Tropicimonas sp.]|uniref:hypothetical protein n=1 Tax=Tropicimonas sp. TaxID=2067044 RepID=UPI003A8C4445